MDFIARLKRSRGETWAYQLFTTNLKFHYSAGSECCVVYVP